MQLKKTIFFNAFPPLYPFEKLDEGDDDDVESEYEDENLNECECDC